MTSSTQRREYSGIAILKKAYRPFFFGAAIWALISIFLWILLLTGTIILPSAFPPSIWHMHEMLFGYTGAVIGGFLLTAIPNWTGRLPIAGLRLLFLFSLWLVGRIIILLSENINPFLVMFADLAFFFLLLFAIFKEIIIGKNWRNLRVIAVFFIFSLSNIFFHLEFIFTGDVQYSSPLALAMIIILIMLIGGRIIPSFTRNWMMRFAKAKLPTPFNQFDSLTMIISIIALFCFVFISDNIISNLLLIIAAIFNFVRLSRWAGIYTIKEPMVFILHIGYLFIPLGFLFIGLNGIFPDIFSGSGAIHLLSAGAIGVMTIAMMTRVSLAHGGQRPEADNIIVLIYLTLIISVIMRIFADIIVSISFLLHISATFWIISFGLFIIRYFKVLTR